MGVGGLVSLMAPGSLSLAAQSGDKRSRSFITPSLVTYKRRLRFFPAIAKSPAASPDACLRPIKKIHDAHRAQGHVMGSKASSGSL